MGENFSGSIHFGIVADEEYLYERYHEKLDDPECEFEYAEEAFEDEVSKLAEGTNLRAVDVGHYEDGGSPWLLVLKDPHVESGYGADYYSAPFNPKALDVGLPAEHLFAIDVAKQLGLDWLKAEWLCCWSVG